MPDLSTMTERRWEVASLIAEGLTSREIGARLYLAEGTVKTHTRAILKTFGVPNRAALITYLLRSGLLPKREGPDGTWQLSDDLFGSIVRMVDYLREGGVDAARELALAEGHRLPRVHQLADIRRGESPTGRPVRRPGVDVPHPRPSSDRT